MRIIKITILLAILAIGAYSFAWYNHANNTRDLIVENLSALKQASGLSDEDFSLSYDSIDVTGYPFRVGIVLTNPQMHYTEVALMRMLVPGKLPPVAKAATENGAEGEVVIQKPLKDSWKLNGKLALSGNYFNRLLAVDVKGSIDSTTEFGTQTLNATTTWDGNSHCHLTLNNSAPLSVFSEHLFSDIESIRTLFPYLQGLSCDTNGISMLDTDVSEILLSSTTQAFAFSSKARGDGQHIITLKADMKDYDVSNRMAQFLDAMKIYFQQSINGMEFAASSDQIAKHFTPTQTGKNNLKLNVRFRGPIAATEATQFDNVDYNLEIKEFEFSNELTNISFPLQVKMLKTPTNIDIVVKSDAKMEFKEGFRKVLSNTFLRAMLGQTFTANDDENAYESQAWQQLESILADPEGARKAIDAAVPRLDEFGIITFASDVHYSGQRDDYGLSRNQRLDVPFITMNSKPYGLRAGGHVAGTFEDLDLSLSCHLCDSLVDDVIGYMNRLDDVALLSNPYAEAAKYDEKTARRLQTFLHQVGTSEDSGETLTINVRNNVDGEILISGKALNQVFMLWLQIFAPTGVADQFIGKVPDGPAPAPNAHKPPPGFQ